MKGFRVNVALGWGELLINVLDDSGAVLFSTSTDDRISIPIPKDTVDYLAKYAGVHDYSGEWANEGEALVDDLKVAEAGATEALNALRRLAKALKGE